MQRLTGWVENGNINVSIAGTGYVSSTKVQGSFPLGTVTVYAAGTLNLSTIYADNSSTPKANPFVAAQSGQWFFYAADGRYDIKFSGGGILSPFTLGDFELFDAAASSGSAGIGFLQSGTGAVERTVQSKLREYFSVTDFGTTGDGAADDYTAINKARLAATASTNGRTLFFPTGLYRLGTSISFDADVSLEFQQGAQLIPDSGRTVNISGTILAPLSRIFAGAGNVYILNGNTYAYPQWWGAAADLSADDIDAMQSCVDACRGTLSGSNYAASCIPYLISGGYKMTRQLNMYDAVNNRSYSGMYLKGADKRSVRLSWQGPVTDSVIKMVGYFQTVSNISITNDIATGWKDAIQYDGVPGIIISTNGRIHEIEIEGNSRPGNGITLGRSLYQSDMCVIDHPFIIGLTNGVSVWTMDSNALSTTLLAPTIAFAWVGVRTNTSTGITILGGEFDNNDLNFRPDGGVPWLVLGTRSESSKKQLFSSTGVYAMPMKFDAYNLSSNYADFHSPPRPATLATSTDLTHLTLTVPNSVTFGDYILVGGTQHARISSMTSPLLAVLDIGLATPVVGATVVLDATVESPNFIENAGGPYNHEGCNFGSLTGGAFAQANGPQTFKGNSWTQNIKNPFNIDIRALNAAYPSKASWEGNYYNGVPTTYMPNWIPSVAQRTLMFVGAEVGGINNALVIGADQPLDVGTTVVLRLDTLTLQIGANTLAYNNQGAQPIWKSTAVANLNPGYAVNSTVTLIWDGSGAWRDPRQ